MRAERSDQGEVSAAVMEMIKEISPLMPGIMGPLMLDLYNRQAILQCWIMLPEQERAPERVEQEIQRRFQGALKDLTAGAAARTSSKPTKQKKPAVDERLALIRAKYPKAYEPWTVEDDGLLRHEHGQGTSIARLSEFCQRQPSAIRSRLLKLGIVQATRGE
jgi:hypothetical protein